MVLVVVVYCYNPSYLGGGGRRLAIQGWSQTKIAITYLKNI
jgi:hypothetical protein